MQGAYINDSIAEPLLPLLAVPPLATTGLHELVGPKLPPPPEHFMQQQDLMKVGNTGRVRLVQQARLWSCHDHWEGQSRMGLMKVEPDRFSSEDIS